MKDSRRTRASALGPRAAGREVDLFREVEFGVCLVNADAAGLDYPESPGQRLAAERPQQGTDQRFQHRQRRVCRQAQNHDTGTSARWKSRHVSEVHIESDEATTVMLANLEQPLVGAAAQLLAFDAGHVVARGTEELLCASAEVLVELELHCPEATATGTYRSRDISAP